MADLRPRVFLSHSGKTGLVGAVLDTLEAKLKDGGFEPLVDRSQIMLGTRFAEEIDRFVQSCDAVVFIITPRALEQDHSWVRDEANQMRQKMIRPSFQAVPVFVGVKPRDLGEAWNAAGLKQLSGVVSKDPTVIADQVVKGLAPTLHKLNSDPVVRKIASELRRITDDDAVAAAAQPVGGWVAGNLRLEIARNLLQSKPQEIVDVACSLALDNRDVARSVLALALPHTWVDRDAARQLCTAIVDGHLAAINSLDLETASAHVLCGWPKYPPLTIEEVGLSPDGENVERDLEQAARTKRGFQDGQLEGDPPGRRVARETPLSPHRIYAFRCHTLDSELLDWINALAQPSAQILLLAPVERWLDVPGGVLNRLAPLQPPLDRAQERIALARTRDARDTLRQLLEDDDHWRLGGLLAI
jgi:hypothetical protein